MHQVHLNLFTGLPAITGRNWILLFSFPLKLNVVPNKLKVIKESKLSVVMYDCKSSG